MIDSGAYIKDGIQSIAKQGVCPEVVFLGMTKPEAIWSYNISKFTIKPSLASYDFGKKNKSVVYYRVLQTLIQIKQALIKGFPIVFGFQVYESFERIGLDGIMHLPRFSEKLLGGHAVLMVGFDDNIVIDGIKGAFIVRNSWGPNWGDKGYFYMPYSYATNPIRANDFWTVTQVQRTTRELILNDVDNLEEITL